MPQGIGRVRFGAAILILTWSGTAIAQGTTSRDRPPSETGLVNRTVPDITLTTSADQTPIAPGKRTLPAGTRFAPVAGSPPPPATVVMTPPVPTRRIRFESVM